MKRIKIFIFLFLIFAVPAFSQVFQNYKVVVRNSEGVLISNKTTTIKLEIQENSGYGKTLYAEMHQRTTSENGIAVIDIGAGESLYGNINDVKNSKAQLFIKTYIDLNDGISFMEMGPSQKTEIPYAFYGGCVPLRRHTTINMAKVAKIEVTDFDGNIYIPVKIGNQTWLKENLRASHYTDGTPINGAFDYNNNPSLAAEYGKLYTWQAAMQNAPPNNNLKSGIQGACPTGYHIPSENEWKTLVDNVSGRGAASGRKLKMPGTNHWDLANGTNETGFSAVGAGFL